MKHRNILKNYLLHHKNPFIRKSTGNIFQIVKQYLKNNDLPIVYANSFPKSGTHLLIQILEAIPGLLNFNSFIASVPSITFKERSLSKHLTLIKKVAPGEIVSAHLFYHSNFHEEIRKKRCAHFFIYRDPRDVSISEAYYLTYMNRWHRLHKYFKAIPRHEDRIMFSITGAVEADFPYDYPNIAKRFERYAGWLQQEDVFSVRYEELIAEKRESVIREMIKFYNARLAKKIDTEEVLHKALNNINPKKSHTFRKGKSGGWKESFTEYHKQIFKELAGDLLIELGYESDKNW